MVAFLDIYSKPLKPRVRREIVPNQCLLKSHGAIFNFETLYIKISQIH